jgi:hypothetical protein
MCNLLQSILTTAETDGIEMYDYSGGMWSEIRSDYIDIEWQCGAIHASAMLYRCRRTKRKGFPLDNSTSRRCLFALVLISYLRPRQPRFLHFSSNTRMRAMARVILFLWFDLFFISYKNMKEHLFPNVCRWISSQRRHLSETCPIPNVLGPR